MSSNKMSQEDLELLFAESYTTIFCSHNKDGTIHAAPIWFRYKEGIFYFISIKKSIRVANIKRNKLVSLALLAQGSKAGEGDAPSKCALVYGEAELGFEPKENYDAYAGWVFGKYTSPRSNESAKFDGETQVTLRVIPKKVIHFYP